MTEMLTLKDFAKRMEPQVEKLRAEMKIANDDAIKNLNLMLYGDENPPNKWKLFWRWLCRKV